MKISRRTATEDTIADLMEAFEDGTESQQVNRFKRFIVGLLAVFMEDQKYAVLVDGFVGADELGHCSANHCTDV